VISHAYISCAGFTVVAVLVASLLCGLLISQDGMLARVLRVGPLAWVGRISYGLYLWNTPVFMTLANCLGHLQPWSGFLIKVAVNFALATLSFYLVEKPFLRLKARFSATRQSTRRQPLFLAAQPQSRAA